MTEKSCEARSAAADAQILVSAVLLSSCAGVARAFSPPHPLTFVTSAKAAVIQGQYREKCLLLLLLAPPTCRQRRYVARLLRAELRMLVALNRAAKRWSSADYETTDLWTNVRRIEMVVLPFFSCFSTRVRKGVHTPASMQEETLIMTVHEPGLEATKKWKEATLLPMMALSTRVCVWYRVLSPYRKTNYFFMYCELVFIAIYLISFWKHLFEW